MINPIQHLDVKTANNVKLGLLGFKHIEVNAFIAQVDEITLTGTSGTAEITDAGGLTKTVTFNADLSTTASDFVTSFAADYLAKDIILTSVGAKLIFTADVAGTGFDSPVITNDTGDLDGDWVQNKIQSSAKL